MTKLSIIIRIIPDVDYIQTLIDAEVVHHALLEIACSIHVDPTLITEQFKPLNQRSGRFE